MSSVFKDVSIGATRDLTKQFKQYRHESKWSRPAAERHDRAERLLDAALGNSTDPEVGVTTGYAPEWMRKSEQIKQEMSTMKDKLTKLKEMHDRALLVSFDTTNDAQAHAEVLTHDLQANFRRLDLAIRSMDKSSFDEDAEVRLQVQRQLAQALFKLSVEFRKEETRFLNRVEAQKGFAAGSSGLLDNEAGLEEEAGFTQAQLAMVDVAHTSAVERDQEIRKIVESITELAQIMRDLSTLVIEQGTILDRIDYNIQDMGIKVEAGVQQLIKADKNQKAGRLWLCVIVLMVLVLIMFVIVIIRYAAGGASLLG